MKKYFIPDYIYNNIYEITPKFLSNREIKGLIIDIDNTLVTYEEPEPTKDVLEWIKSIQSRDILVSFVSNNEKNRVERFNKNLQFFASYDSKKPSRKALHAAMEYMKLPNKNIAVIGDQVFTDVLAAKRANLIAILVSPIENKETIFFKIKRQLERPFIKAYYNGNKRG